MGRSGLIPLRAARHDETSAAFRSNHFFTTFSSTPDYCRLSSRNSSNDALLGLYLADDSIQDRLRERERGGLFYRNDS